MHRNGGVQPAEKQLPPALCAAQRFGDDLFHNAVCVQVLCCQLHHGAGLAAAGSIFPQNAGKPLGAEHRIHGVFQHQNVVGNAQAQRAAAGPLAGDNGQHRDSQTTHLHQVAGNGFSLAALFGIFAGVSARGVNESDDGTMKFLCLLHHAQGLAVALGSRHAKVAVQVFFQRGPFAVPQNGNGHPVEPCDPA